MHGRQQKHLSDITVAVLHQRLNLHLVTCKIPGGGLDPSHLGEQEFLERGIAEEKLGGGQRVEVGVLVCHTLLAEYSGYQCSCSNKKKKEEEGSR